MERQDRKPVIMTMCQQMLEDATREGKTHLEFALARALKSLKAYPLPLYSGQDALVLHGVGKNLADRFDRALAALYPEQAPTIEQPIQHDVQEPDVVQERDVMQRKVQVVVEEEEEEVEEEGDSDEECSLIPERLLAGEGWGEMGGRVEGWYEGEGSSRDIREFEVSMLVDTSEKGGVVRKMFAAAEAVGMGCESVRLSVGDVVFVAREPDGRMWVLDVVVERKEREDLWRSITGTSDRYRQQWFRLERAGVVTVVYVVEGRETASEPERKNKSLKTATARLEVEGGFLVHQTDDAEATAQYVVRLGERLRRRLRGTTLCVGGRDGRPRLEAWNACMSENARLTLRDAFARMLLSVPGLGQEAVEAVTRRFGTIAALCQALEAVRSHAERLAVLSSIAMRSGRTLSSRQAELVCSLVLGPGDALTAIHGQFSSRLSAIKGMSAKRAAAIRLKYPAETDLHRAWRACTDRPSAERLLSSIQVGSSRLGPSLSKRTFDELYASEWDLHQQDEGNIDDILLSL